MSNKKIYYIIFFVILAGLGVFFWTQKYPRVLLPPMLPPASTQNTTSRLVPDPVLQNAEVLSFPDNTIDTSDWQTYRNEELGFEVKYPKGWRVKDYWGGGPLGENVIGLVNFYPTPRNDGDDRGVYITVKTRRVSDPLDKISKNVEFKKISVNNLIGIFYSIDNNFAQQNNTIAILDDGQDSYHFTMVSAYDEFFEKIILSFRSIK